MRLSASEVYTGDGIWTYDITDSLEDDINKATPCNFNKWMILESMIHRETFFILGNKSLSRKEKIEHYTSAVKKLGVNLSYHSLDE